MKNQILLITAECRRRKALGERVIDLSLGEPDFETPARITAAATRALEQGQTRYTPTAGLSPLRVALRKTLSREGLDYSPREVMVTCGATGALWCAFRAQLRPGDEVLLPAPFFPPYAAQIGLAGGVPVLLKTRQADGFKLTAAGLRAAVTDRSRLLVLNTPANPSGAVYTRDELEALAAVVVETGLLVISDEVYSTLVYAAARHTSLAALGETVRKQVLLVRSFSKSHAMTGWRVGFAAGPEALIREMTSVQELGMVCLSSASQWAALEATREVPGEGSDRLFSLEARRDYLHQRLERMDGVRLVRAEGALFVFPDLSERVSDVTGFCRSLLERESVALVPGAEFGVPECVRISFAASMPELVEGMDRLAQGLIAYAASRYEA